MIKNRKGSIYITVISASVLFFILASILIVIFTSHIKYGTTQQNRSKAYYVAESGVTMATSYIKSNLKYLPNQSGNGGIITENKDFNQLIRTVTTKPYFVTDDKLRIPINSIPSQIYIEGKTHNPPSSVQINQLPFLKEAITAHKEFLHNRFVNLLEKTSSIQNSETYTETCNNCTLVDLENKIKSSNYSNYIFKVQSIYTNSPEVVTLGSSSKSVTLIVDNVTINSTSTLNIYGNLIVNNNMLIGHNYNLNLIASKSLLGDLWVKNNLTNNNTANIIASNIIDAKSLTIQNATYIKSKSLIVLNELLNNNLVTIDVEKDIVLGYLKAYNVTTLISNSDIIIENNVEVYSNLRWTAYGSIAIGGDLNVYNTISITNTGGKKTSLIVSGGTGEGDNGNWSKWKPCIKSNNNPNNRNPYGWDKKKQECITLPIQSDSFIPFPEYEFNNLTQYQIVRINNTNFYDIISIGQYHRTTIKIECRLEYNEDNSISIVYFNEI